MKEYLSKSVDETYEIGRKTALEYGKGTVFAYFGDLGMGKTAFTKGLVQGFGIDAEVTSPTFALVNEYRSEGITLYHFDMYRISTWEDLYSTGYFDYVDTDAVLAIEWSENIENALPDDCVCIEISKGEDDNSRIIRIGSKEELRK